MPVDDQPHLAPPPGVMHALLNESDEDVLVPGRLYPTMCGTHWEHQPLTKAEVRTRYVCALCHQAQVETLRTGINFLINRVNTLEGMVGR